VFCKQFNYTYKFIKHDTEPEMLTQKTTPTPVQELASVWEGQVDK
jgi:hypothetical protein